MPVPIAVTHPQGKGVAIHLSKELETEGPFARLKKQAVADAAVTAPISSQQQTNGTNGHEDTATTPVEATEKHTDYQEVTVAVNHLEFAYPGLDGRPIPGQPPLITDLTLSLKRGSRVLLLGANGAGKTTLLKILGGKHMVTSGAVSVLGRRPFQDTSLTTSGDLAYVGGNWTRDIAFAGTSVPLSGDFPASRMIDSVPGADPERKARLMRVLDIDPNWRMHMVSDGQRRRVQICVGLLRPFKVLLLDEITVDLDVLGRSQLMRFLADEAETRGATIIYATHIFDGLEEWPTHVAYVARGRLQMMKPACELPELQQGRLLELVVSLLQNERRLSQAAGFKRALEYDPSREGAVDAGFSYAFNNGWVPGTMVSSLKDSSNAVMRG